MRGAYRFFAGFIALEVAVQAAAMALGVFGLTKWIDEGGTLDKATFENADGPLFGEEIGFAIHAINGMMRIPLLALLLLIVSFFTKLPGSVKWAAIVLAAVVIQVLLGLFGHGAPALGALHGINALIVFGSAVMAAMHARRGDTTGPATTTVGQPTRV